MEKMDRKKQLEREIAVFVKEHVAMLLEQHMRQDTLFLEEKEKRAALARELAASTEVFFAYEEAMNAYIQLVAETCYQEGLLEAEILWAILTEKVCYFCK